jgi:hypothetical protein
MLGVTGAGLVAGGDEAVRPGPSIAGAERVRSGPIVAGAEPVRRATGAAGLTGERLFQTGPLGGAGGGCRRTGSRASPDLAGT